MTDIQAHLDKIRSDAAECILLSSLATDGKREVFARTAEHLNALASEIEKTLATNTADKGTRGESVHVARPADHEGSVAADIVLAHQQPVARPRRMLQWFLVVVLGSVVATFFWANNPVKEYWSLLSTLQSKRETSPAPQNETKQAIATLLSGEQAERKILMEQLGALAARLDSLVTALDNLKTSRGEIAGPSNKVGAEEKPPAAETKPSGPEEKPVREEENRTPTLGTPAATKRSDGVPPATDGREQLIELEPLRFLHGELNLIRANPVSALPVARNSALSIRYPGHTRRWKVGGASAGSKMGLTVGSDGTPCRVAVDSF